MMNTDKIPISLRTDALFCCWKYEERDGKQTKVPYNPATGKRAESNNSDTFSDFETTVSASGQYTGVGVGVFRGVCGIDIDHCMDESGTLSAAAADMIETINSYTERSPSGSGIHILFKAEGFAYDKTTYYINNQKSGIEVYVYGATNKYLTLTGDALYESRDIEERSEALSVVLDKYMCRKQKPLIKSESTRSHADEPIYDEGILQKASKARNGEKFNKLWNGDFSGYSSQSEADQALCSILAFHAKGDTQQVDRLFRQSGLMRSK